MYLTYPCCWGNILGTKSLLPPIIISVGSFPEVDPGVLLFLKLPEPWGPPESEGRATTPPSTSISIHIPAVDGDLVVKHVGAVKGMAIYSHQRPREGCGHTGRLSFSL